MPRVTMRIGRSSGSSAPTGSAMRHAVDCSCRRPIEFQSPRRLWSIPVRGEGQMPDAIADTGLQSLIDYYGEVVAGRAGSGFAMACSDRLERAALDYSVDSLQVIDQYLLIVHGAQEGIPTVAYANTIMATAIYVGEVIRRGSPATEYRWGRAQDSQAREAGSMPALSDLSDLVLLNQVTGAALSTTDVVLRLIRHGKAAPPVYSFAVKLIRRAWSSGQV